MTEIKEIEIEAFIQATEDPEKVLLAIRRILPDDLHDELGIEKVRGVFHNPITIIRAKFKNNMYKIIELIAQKLGEEDKNYIFQSLNRRLDKLNLYLRFNKQALYQDQLKIKEIQDTIKVRIGFAKKFSNQEKLVELLQGLELVKV